MDDFTLKSGAVRIWRGGIEFGAIMKTEKALQILKILADGIDPTSGEVFANGSVYNRPEVIRALFVAIDALERIKRNERRKSTLPENAGKPWDKLEDEVLSSEFDSGKSIGEIANLHKRTTGAIESRLIKLGKIER